MMAEVYSLVEALPPRSPVMVLPSAIVLRAILVLIFWRKKKKDVAYRESCPFNLVGMFIEIHVPLKYQFSSVRDCR
jgi:hypothetical protein